ncbi:hypothetical protein AKUH4B210M_09580 [Apilactobacillus kunkeei]|nr:hypothetical protein AKUH4B210M_09580 [Apilactobacillus kunkeei]
MKMKKVVVRRYSNDNKPKVVQTASNGTIVDQFIKYGDINENVKIENMEMPNKLNVKPELVHVTNNKDGKNIKYTLSTYSYDEVNYEYEGLETVNDKLMFLSQMHYNQDDTKAEQIDNEWSIMNNMVFDWFDKPQKRFFKNAANVILNANKNINGDKIDLQSSSVNGFDVVHIYKGNIHLTVSAFYDGSFKAIVYNDSKIADNYVIAESKKAIEEEYISEFINLNF